MPTLVLLQGGKAIPYELSSDDVTLGRHPDCEIQLESNMVSRRHAKLHRDTDGFFLEDLGSGNGSYLNGKRVEGNVRINHGDRIKVGPLLLRFEDQKPAGVPHQEKTVNFGLDLAGDEDDTSTIMGSASAGGYGLLEVRPEAKLKAILDITRSLAGTVDMQKLLPRILDALFEVFPQADRGSILRDTESGRMVPAAQKHRRENEDATVKLSRTILKRVLEQKEGVLSADAANDARFDASESISSLTIRSMMCVPMLDLEGNASGVINIDTQNPEHRFQESDLDLLTAVACQAALSYESARLLVSHMQKLKQDGEMDIASGVQHALLPETLPAVKGYEFYASYDAAQAVGGDYYDVIRLSDTKMCVSFGDVAGKGVPGALIMSRMSSVVQSTMSFTDDVSEAITAINNHMCHNMVDGRFVTYILIVIDLTTNEMSLVNGGHMMPLIRSPDGTVIDDFNPDTIGVPVGIMEDYPYEVVTRVLQPGETVVLITDGVDEAMNPAGTLYGKERVREFVSKSSPNPRELGQAMLADVRRHANGRPQNDDITIMTFGRLLQAQDRVTSGGSTATMPVASATPSIDDLEVS